MFIGVPTPTFWRVTLDDNQLYTAYLNTLATVYMSVMFGYLSFVVILSVFTINWVPLRIAEDVFLVCFAAFACYLLILNTKMYTPEEFLVVFPENAPKSC